MTGRAKKAELSCLMALLVTLIALGIAAEPARAVSKNKLLITSDIHFNPMADTKLVADLAASDPNQWEPILQRSSPVGFSQYGEDTNWWLLKSALDQMRKTLPHPAFVVVDGDLLAHRFRQKYQASTHDDDLQHYRSFVLKTVEFLALELRTSFPKAKILLTPGNDDDDCGDYTVRASGAFLNDTAEVVRDLAQADESLLGDWKALGSYSVPHPTLSGVRVVSLNSVFFSNNYEARSFREGCAVVSSTAAADLLRWLESNLAAAQQANQKVWLMFHIPPGIDGYASTHNAGAQGSGPGTPPAKSCADSIVPMWVPIWTAQFDTLLETYRSTVLVSLAGHTHVDDFRLLNTAGVDQSFVLIDPPVSPIYNQNPAFRVATYKSDGTLADQSTYYLTNLRQASRQVPGRWKKEYTFTQEWKKPVLDIDSLSAVYNEIPTAEATRARWLKLYNVSSSAAVVPPDTVPGLYCAIRALSPAAYEQCYCERKASQPVSPAKL